MKALFVALIAIAVVAAVVCGCVALNPLRRSPASIEHRLYKITPFGTSFEFATNRLSKVFAEISFSENTGFVRHDWPGPWEVVGSKAIKVHLGEYYQFPVGRTGVAAYWGFDDKGKLIEIWVRKDTDSL